MAVSQGFLLLHVYAPALAGRERRPLAVVQAMERAMHGLRLMWTISSEGQFIRVEEHVRGSVNPTTGRHLLLCNGNEDHLVTMSRLETPGGLNPGGMPLFEVFAKWPLDASGVAAAADVLEGVGVGALAFWAEITPDGAVGDIDDQSSPTPEGPPNPPRGLPVLRRPEDIRAPEIPSYLGWLNYWSAGTARAIGFPDPARDVELLSRSRRTESGGWVVRLTDAPLDLDNPGHLQALLRAYERFPEIGGRAAS